ncbi:hypothetical protein N6G05_26960, partial [Cupriavidus gilardii]|nr:hypothetical protein [Cupriavidus gilardii]MCT9056855.1 hypothetical protein [Cupriavidus gilardii]
SFEYGHTESAQSAWEAGRTALRAEHLAQQPAAQAAGLTDEGIIGIAELDGVATYETGWYRMTRGGLLAFARALLSRAAPSAQQAEPGSPMKAAADALRRKAELEQAHQDGYRDGFKAAQAMLSRAAPSGEPVAKHVSWLHQCLREAGHCIDGGKCHHRCGPQGKCFRELNCAPLSRSGLGPDWKLPSAQQAEYPCMSCADCADGSPHMCPYMCPYKGPTQACVSGEQPAEEARGVAETLRSMAATAPAYEAETLEKAAALLAAPAAGTGQEPAFWLSAEDAEFIRAGYQLSARVTALHKGGGKRVACYLDAPQAATGAQGLTWISVNDRLPPIGTGERVLIYTEGADFAGEQF